MIRDLFSKETDPNIFIGLPVQLQQTGNEGKIMGTFGKSGKLKVKLREPLPEDTQGILGSEV